MSFIQKIIFSVFFLCFFHLTKAQEKQPVFMKPAELGASLFTLNSIDKFDAVGTPQMEYINGLFFRYSLKRVAFRVQISFAKNDYPNYFETTTTENFYRQDFKTSIGLQYNLLKKRSILYTFFDGGYRAIKEHNISFSDVGFSTHLTTVKQSGFSSYLGLGSKFTFFRTICLSPEVAVNFYIPTVLSSYENPYTQINNLSEGVELKTLAFFKLHLTVKF